MAEQCKTKGFTRVDVSALVLVGLLLLATVPLACRQLRSESPSARLTCRANLAGIGKAMLIYASDYEDELPRAGGPTTTWGGTPNWAAPDRYTAFGLSRDRGSGGTASISASLYLLVKYAEVMPKHFVCPGDAGTTDFRLSELHGIPANYELIDAWDFGPPAETFKHCSYAYHIPYGRYALTTSRDPHLAVAADRNPWITQPAADARPFTDWRPDVPPWNGSAEMARAGNAIQHQGDGQNVLFLDGHVAFETRAYCGVRKDNIYTISVNPATGGDVLGTVPVPSSGLQPTNENDSILVHDPDTFGGGGPPLRRR